MGRSIALEAQRMVQEAAEPIVPGEVVKAQMRRAARALKYPDGDWRIRAAWYCEAGCWSAAAFEELRERYGAWRERQRQKALNEARVAAAVYDALADQLRGKDEEFHSADVAALVSLARRLRGQDDGEVK